MQKDIHTPQKKPLAWRAYEHTPPQEKTSDWFWALGFVVAGSALAAIILGNTLFGIVLILGGIIIGLSANQQPKKVTYRVTPRGIAVDKTLYPYKNLEAFWIDETSHPKRDMLIIDAQHPFMPHLIINLPKTVDKDALQDYLLDYLPEVELYEPISHRIAALFGF